jgi:hypothetical protein
VGALVQGEEGCTIIVRVHFLEEKEGRTYQRRKGALSIGKGVHKRVHKIL